MDRGGLQSWGRLDMYIVPHTDNFTYSEGTQAQVWTRQTWDDKIFNSQFVLEQAATVLIPGGAAARATEFLAAAQEAATLAKIGWTAVQWTAEAVLFTSFSAAVKYGTPLAMIPGVVQSIDDYAKEAASNLFMMVGIKLLSIAFAPGEEMLLKAADKQAAMKKSLFDLRSPVAALRLSSNDLATIFLAMQIDVIKIGLEAATMMVLNRLGEGALDLAGIQHQKSDLMSWSEFFQTAAFIAELHAVGNIPGIPLHGAPEKDTKPREAPRAETPAEDLPKLGAAPKEAPKVDVAPKEPRADAAVGDGSATGIVPRLEQFRRFMSSRRESANREVAQAARGVALDRFARVVAGREGLAPRDLAVILADALQNGTLSWPDIKVARGGNPKMDAVFLALRDVRLERFVGLVESGRRLARTVLQVEFNERWREMERRGLSGAERERAEWDLFGWLARESSLLNRKPSAPGSKDPTSDIDRSWMSSRLRTAVKAVEELRMGGQQMDRLGPTTARAFDVNEYFNVLARIPSIVRDWAGFAGDVAARLVLVGGRRIELTNADVVEASTFASAMMHMTPSERLGWATDKLAGLSGPVRDRVEAQLEWARRSLVQGRRRVAERVAHLVEAYGADGHDPDTWARARDLVYGERMDVLRRLEAQIDALPVGSKERLALEGRWMREMGPALREGIEAYTDAAGLDLVVNALQTDRKGVGIEPGTKWSTEQLMNDPNFSIDAQRRRYTPDQIKAAGLIDLSPYSVRQLDGMINDQVMFLIEHVHDYRLQLEDAATAARAFGKYVERVMITLKIQGIDIVNLDLADPRRRLYELDRQLVANKGSVEGLLKVLGGIGGGDADAGMRRLLDLIDAAIPGMKGRTTTPLAELEMHHHERYDWRRPLGDVDRALGDLGHSQAVKVDAPGKVAREVEQGARRVSLDRFDRVVSRREGAAPREVAVTLADALVLGTLSWPDIKVARGEHPELDPVFLALRDVRLERFERLVRSGRELARTVVRAEFDERWRQLERRELTGAERDRAEQELFRWLTRELSLLNRKPLAQGSKDPTSDIDRSWMSPRLRTTVKALEELEMGGRQLDKLGPTTARAFDVNEYFNVLARIPAVVRDWAGFAADVVARLLVGGRLVELTTADVVEAGAFASAMMHMTPSERLGWATDKLAGWSGPVRDRVEAQLEWARSSLAEGRALIAEKVAHLAREYRLDVSDPDTWVRARDLVYGERMAMLGRIEAQIDALPVGSVERLALEGRWLREMGPALREGIEAYTDAAGLDLVVNGLQTERKGPGIEPGTKWSTKELMNDPNFSIEAQKQAYRPDEIKALGLIDLSPYSVRQLDGMINDQVMFLIEHVHAYRLQHEDAATAARAFGKYVERVMLALKIQGIDIVHLDPSDPRRRLFEIDLQLVENKGSVEGLLKVLEALSGTAENPDAGMRQLLDLIDAAIPGMKGLTTTPLDELHAHHEHLYELERELVGVAP
jgi:hypothetical protein